MLSSLLELDISTSSLDELEMGFSAELEDCFSELKDDSTELDDFSVLDSVLDELEDCFSELKDDSTELDDFSLLEELEDGFVEFEDGFVGPGDSFSSKLRPTSPQATINANRAKIFILIILRSIQGNIANFY